MTDISGNRTDLVGDPSRSPGQLPADAQGQATARSDQQAALPAPRPAHVANITGPSTRPSEPVQAGLPIGPGPGPSGMLTPEAQSMVRLKAAARRRQSPTLMRLINRLESTRGR